MGSCLSLCVFLQYVRSCLCVCLRCSHRWKSCKVNIIKDRKCFCEDLPWHYFVREKSFVAAGACIVRGREREAKPSGWDGKVVRAGKSLPRSILADGVFFGWVGCGCSLTQDPATDVTFLPVKAGKQSITHRRARHKPVLQETSVSLFYDFSLCFTLGSPKRNVTLLLPDGNFPSTFQWISEPPRQKRKGPCAGAVPNPSILKSGLL